MDLSTVLERSDLGHLRELLDEEELNLECFQVLKLSDLNEPDRDPLMNLIDELNSGAQGKAEQQWGQQSHLSPRCHPFHNCRRCCLR
jgi:hypothetical protein